MLAAGRRQSMIEELKYTIVAGGKQHKLVIGDTQYLGAHDYLKLLPKR